MHWEFLPKVTHNEDAIREYEREESEKIGKWLMRLALFVVPVVLVVWILRQ